MAIGDLVSLSPLLCPSENTDWIPHSSGCGAGMRPSNLPFEWQLPTPSQIRLRDTEMPSAREVLLFVRTQGPRVVTTRPGCLAAACTAPAPVLH